MEQEFTIIVQNVNEAPVSSVFKSTGGQLSFPDNQPRVNENSKIGTQVGEIHVTDKDANESLVFSLDNDAGGLFSVSRPSLVTCFPVSELRQKPAVLSIVGGVLTRENFQAETQKIFFYHWWSLTKFGVKRLESRSILRLVCGNWLKERWPGQDPSVTVNSEDVGIWAGRLFSSHIRLDCLGLAMFTAFSLKYGYEILQIL